MLWQESWIDVESEQKYLDRNELERTNKVCECAHACACTSCPLSGQLVLSVNQASLYLITNCISVSSLNFIVNVLWRFRDPVVIVWVASFGSALHYPVTTYFLLEVGATKVSGHTQTTSIHSLMN